MQGCLCIYTAQLHFSALLLKSHYKVNNVKMNAFWSVHTVVVDECFKLLLLCTQINFYTAYSFEGNKKMLTEYDFVILVEESQERDSYARNSCIIKIKNHPFLKTSNTYTLVIISVLNQMIFNVLTSIVLSNGAIWKVFC